MLLKASQVTSFQQREGVLQKRLYHSIISYARVSNTKIAISEESSLPELVKVTSSLLQDVMESLQNKELAHFQETAENEQPVSTNYHGKGRDTTEHSVRFDHDYSKGCFPQEHSFSVSNSSDKSQLESSLSDSRRRRPPPQPPKSSHFYSPR